MDTRACSPRDAVVSLMGPQPSPPVSAANLPPRRADPRPRWSRAGRQERPMFTDSQGLAGHKSDQLIDHKNPKLGHSHTGWDNRGPVGGEGTRVIVAAVAAGPRFHPLPPCFVTLSVTLPEGAPT